MTTLAQYRDTFHQFDRRFWFRDCAVRSRDLYAFVLEPELTARQEREELEKGMGPDLRVKGIAVAYDLTEDEWYYQFRSDWHSLTIGACQKPENHSLTVEQFCAGDEAVFRCFVAGSGREDEDPPLRIQDPWTEQDGEQGCFFRSGALLKIKAIDGWPYACGLRRCFGKWLGTGSWQSFTQFFPDDEEVGITGGFEDFDGFSESDIYLAGAEGDAWHFNGKEAERLPIPTNIDLGTVCCGGDGEVYISGTNGETWHGRGDRWQKIDHEEPYEEVTSLPFRDMVWYEDKVWATNDHGLWVIEDNVIKKADVPDWVYACSGDLSVGDGVLLLSGYGGAAFRENGEWHKILLFDEMEARA